MTPGTDLENGGNESASAHIWAEGGTWYVGMDFDSGLAMPSFDAALALADLWLRLTGRRMLVIRDEHGTTGVFSESGLGE
jgi:hypothetical protein